LKKLKAIKLKKGKKGKFPVPVINMFTSWNYYINKISGIRILHNLNKTADKFAGQILLPETIPKAGITNG
jgi:hypothetical protein